MPETELPAGCALRAATARDLPAIRRLVWQAKLDPTQLRWQQFWVVDCQGQLVGCGQLRRFAGAQELGSVVVAPAWRRRGIGTAIAQHAIGAATQPLYLECLGRQRAQFFGRLGFEAVAWRDLPRSLRRKFAPAALARTVLRLPVAVMQYRGTATAA